MATLALTLGAIGAGAQVLGGIQSARAGEQDAINQQAVAEFEAKQADTRAKEEMAAASIEAQEISKRKRLALSQLQARAAGGGFMADDATAMTLASDIESRGQQQVDEALRQGEINSIAHENLATGRRTSGQMARAGSRGLMSSAILRGVSSFSKYAASAAAGMPGAGGGGGNLRYG